MLGTKRGGTIFDTIQNLKERFGPPEFHFEWAQDFNLFESWFWSIWKLFEISLLVQFEQMKVDQKWVFEQFMVMWFINWTKIRFESRGAYACQLNFDPPQFLFEINDHVTKTHFWSAFKLIENLILIQFELMKKDQN